jgi:hypothetical protein
MRKLLCPLLALAFLFGTVSIPTASAAAPPDKGTEVVKKDKKGKQKGKKGKKKGGKQGKKKGKKKAAAQA